MWTHASLETLSLRENQSGFPGQSVENRNEICINALLASARKPTRMKSPSFGGAYPVEWLAQDKQSLVFRV